MFSWRNVREDPINTCRPFYEKFQNGPSPYYRPWFFGVLRGFQKSQILTERPYYRPCFLGEMFKRTQSTLIDPFMRNFKMATILEKALTIYRPWFFEDFKKAKFWRKGLTIDHVFLAKCSRGPNQHLQTLLWEIQNGHIFGKSPYYRPWFFGVLRGFQKSQILRERPYYRPCFLGEMFKRTQLTRTDPFMRNFKMATFLEKALTIDHAFWVCVHMT